MAKAWKVKGVKPQKSYRRNASIILSAKIAEVYSWDNYIGDPENIEELHNMRISIKRLRYSMEVFSVNYISNLMSRFRFGLTCKSCWVRFTTVMLAKMS